VVVKEVRTGRVIPYTACSLLERTEFDPIAAKRIAMKADGWFFMGGEKDTSSVAKRYVPHDTLKARVGLGTKYLFIKGIRLGIKTDGSSLRPTDPLPDSGAVWVTHANDSIRVPPRDLAYDLEIDKGLWEIQKLNKLNVKVVPNPYMITNEWQTTRFRRKLKFINLPPTCWIRIYTVNGDLIKTLYHNMRGPTGPDEFGGDEWWDVLTENNQMPASGVYIFHVYGKNSDGTVIGEQVGKFVIIQ